MMRKIDNDMWITLILGILLFITARLAFLINRVNKLETIERPIRNYDNEKDRLTKLYDETNMRINEIHHILSESKTHEN